MSIALRGVSKQFGAYAAVTDIDLDVPTGALFALLGPSGCGKTTLLRIIAGLEAPDAGQVLFDGRDATEWPIRERKVGFVFQQYALFRHMSVFENIAFGLKIKPRRERPAAAAIAKKVRSLLELVQLDWTADRYPAQLSGGQRQRIALARALAVEPALLLLDEVADSIVVLNHGRIEQQGVPGEIYDAPSSAFVHRFLGQVNELPVSWTADGRVMVGNLAVEESPISAANDREPQVALVRPHEIELSRESGGWRARVLAVRVIGPIVRIDLAADGRPAQEPLEAEISRERYALDRFAVGDSVSLRLRGWQLYTAETPRLTGP
jgi:sulfate transport system ATP-binding protein